MSDRWWCVMGCMGMFWLAACGESATQTGASSTPVCTTVAGQVLYEDRAYDAHGFTGALDWVPARALIVQVVSLSGAVWASGVTDAEGAFSMCIDPRFDASYRVRALAWVDVEGHQARVLDRGEHSEVYALQSESLRGSVSSLSLRVSIEEGAGAFNVADVLGEGLSAVVRWMEQRSSLLTVYWAPERSFACTSCYGDDVISLGGSVADPDEFDDDIILHEFGHYVADHVTRDSSPGGFHRDRLVPPTLAYGEGLAYFLACAIQNTPEIVDNYQGAYRSIDLEQMTFAGERLEALYGSSNGQPDGWLREEVVAGLLWDLLDAASPEEPFDRIQLPFASILRVLAHWFRPWRIPNRGVAGVDLSDIFHVFRCEEGVDSEALDALLSERGVVLDDACEPHSL